MKHLVLCLLLIAIVAACKKSEEAQPVLLDKTDVQMHFKETYSFKLTQGGTTVDVATYNWVSKDTVIGKVDNKGAFLARRVGETTVTATSKDGKNKVEAKVTVTPTTTMFKMPVIEFGISKATLKTKETRVVAKDTVDALVYQPENTKIRGVIYTFKNAALTESNVFPGVTDALVQEAGDYLDERFEYLGQDTNEYYYFAISPTVLAAYFWDDAAGPRIVFFAGKKNGRLPAFSGRTKHLPLTISRRP